MIHAWAEFFISDGAEQHTKDSRNLRSISLLTVKTDSSILSFPPPMSISIPEIH